MRRPVARGVVMPGPSWPGGREGVGWLGGGPVGGGWAGGGGWKPAQEVGCFRVGGGGVYPWGGGLVGGGGSEAGPGVGLFQVCEGGHVLVGAGEHAMEHVVFDVGVVVVVLAGGADEQLAVGFGVEVEGDGVSVRAADAFEIAELDELVAGEVGGGVSEDEGGFAGADGGGGGKRGGGCAAGGDAGFGGADFGGVGGRGFV